MMTPSSRSTTMLHVPFRASASFLHPSSSLPKGKGTSSESDSTAPLTGKLQQWLLPAPSNDGTNRNNHRRHDLDLPPPSFHRIPKKPMRPLTAYHIFFQIEREHIIQTISGEDADTSIHDEKIYLENVPLRYRNIKLLPDWYAGPGKRKKKRKHRKQHGKIGFLELSRVISARWPQLEEIDPETRDYVRKIAKRELEEYYREMEAYRAATGEMATGAPKKSALRSTTAPPGRRATNKKKCNEGGKNPSSRSSMRRMQQPHHNPRRMSSTTTSFFPEEVSSSSRAMIDFANSCRFQPRRDDIDDFLLSIDNKSQHHLLPSSFGAENQVPKERGVAFHRQDDGVFNTLQPFVRLMGESNSAERPDERRRRRASKNVVFVNDASSSVEAAAPAPVKVKSPPPVEVDICDDEILQLWKAHN